MHGAISVSDVACIVNCYVREGESIAPDAAIMDIMMKDGIVETLRADRWGIIAHVEANDNTIYRRGDIICHIASLQEGANGKKAGLNPRPSRWARMQRGLNPRL